MYLSTHDCQDSDDFDMMSTAETVINLDEVSALVDAGDKTFELVMNSQGALDGVLLLRTCAHVVLVGFQWQGRGAVGQTALHYIRSVEWYCSSQDFWLLGQSALWFWGSKLEHPSQTQNHRGCLFPW